MIGMGKLGGRELNYASDVDVLFVSAEGRDEDSARHILQIARCASASTSTFVPRGDRAP